IGNLVRVSQIHPAIISLTTCLAGHSVPPKSPACAYQSPSISSIFVILPYGLVRTSALYPSLLSASFLTVHSLILYHPLGLDSRTPGICSGPYDDVLRTTCGRNEFLTRCGREGK
ncbi:hypothetical protein K443DRAFT_107451, partial [Laccaria amethystina LaAM-08-1]